jgi:hypothetical protein
MPAVLTVREPLRGRDANGRFAPNNLAAADRGYKALAKRQMGSEAKGPELEELYRQTKLLFRGFMRSLPADDPHIQDLAARCARSSAMSARYAASAAAKGLDSPEGQKAMELSIKLDQRAERLAVTAWDLAHKTNASRPAKATDFPWLKPAEDDDE